MTDSAQHEPPGPSAPADSPAGSGGALLASDLDGTLLPPAWSSERAQELGAFRAAVADADGLTLAYVTGRHLDHALEGIHAFGLPLPAYLACEVGASLYVRNGDGYGEVSGFRTRMAMALGTTADEVRAALVDIPGLTPQGPEHQGEFKASFLTPWPLPRGLLEQVVGHLDGVGARTTLVTSRGLRGEGLLDVLPLGGAKDGVVRYLAEALGLEERRVLFAGDSGNDRAALLAGTLGVVVANASRSLVEDIRAEARRLGRMERIHFATRPYAGGVLEGMSRFGIGLPAEAETTAEADADTSADA